MFKKSAFKNSAFKKFAVAALVVAGSVGVAQARDAVHHFDFNKAVQSAKQKGLIDGSVQFYLAGTGGQGQVIQKDIVTNKKTRGMGRSAEEGCEHVLHSAIIQMHNAAKERGATKVTNIVSYFKKNEYRSSTQYECHKGTAIASVALKGDLVR